MITVTTSPTANGPGDKANLLAGTKAHIEDVKHALQFFCQCLEEASKVHDHTKVDDIDDFYRDSEKGFDKLTSKPWWKKHLTERHHLNDHCPDDVNLVDVIEYICDCVMAGMARDGSVYELKLKQGILEDAFQNTIKLLKGEIDLQKNR